MPTSPPPFPLAVTAGFQNSGQACLAGTRILVPEHRLDEAVALARAAVEAVKVGDPRDAATEIGPMVSRKQWERVQGYIRKGVEEGARLIAGGEGRPELASMPACTCDPPCSSESRNDMVIAREEIFGPCSA